MKKGRINHGVIQLASPWLGIGVALAIAGCMPTVSGNANGNTDGNGNTNSNSNDNGSTDNTVPVTDGDWYRPLVSTTWQWQLQPDSNGDINIGYDVDVYDIDLFDVDKSVIDELQSAGRRVICYFSAGSYEDFRPDSAQFSAEDRGNTLEGFADEQWLDIRSQSVRDIMLARLDLAVGKNCDGVEPDNVTGYSNDTGFNLTADDQLDFNRFLANEAHRRGLAVALKNDLDQIPDLVDFFDFSINEQCHEFDECDSLLAFIDAGKPVFVAEYADPFVNDAAARAAMCDEARAANLRTLVLPLDLDDSLRFSCDE